MKQLSLIFTLFLALGFFTEGNAQNSSPKIESFDEMLSEIEKGMDEMLETLRSEQFQNDLEKAVGEAQDELNITKDADGNLLFNGQQLDLDGFTEPGNDILDLFKNDFHISGDLSEMLEDSGAVLERFFESLGEEMEANYQFFEDLELNFDIDSDGDCGDKKKGKSGTITL